jgi:hypothetical protein
LLVRYLLSFFPNSRTSFESVSEREDAWKRLAVVGEEEFTCRRAWKLEPSSPTAIGWKRLAVVGEKE